MADLRLTPAAQADLADIWRYTRDRWSEAQADRYYGAFTVAFDGLASGETRGRRVAERKGYLKYTVGSHLLFYREQGGVIEVVRILHSRMDVETWIE